MENGKEISGDTILNRFLSATLAAIWLILPSSGKSSEVRDLTSQLLLDRQGRNLTPILDADSFDRLVHRTLAHFDKHAERNGAKLTYEIFWNSSSSGAFTLRKDQGRTWHVFVYDGILRLPYATEDLISAVLCHEVGHHLGGYPFKENAWAAAEGQADYFAMQVCLPELFALEPQRNAEYRDLAPEVLKRLCNQSFADQSRRDICYREAVVIETLLKYEGNDGKVKLSLTKKDPLVVETTNLLHPSAQCRIDTSVSGVLCNLNFKLGHIPGYFGKGQNTSEAEQDSDLYVCKGSANIMARPSCWYRSLLE